MFTLALKDFKAQMFCTYVELTSTVQPPKLRLWNKKRPREKYVTITIKFMHKYTNGSTLILITLEELQHNGILKSVKTSS